MTDLDQTAMPYFPAVVEQAERETGQRVWDTDRYLRASGGRRGCPHPAHRFAQVPDSPASLILPECAGREAWLAARLDGVGGSEVGALVGISEYETAASIWNTKKHGGKDLSDRPAVEWGHRLEEVVAAKTAEEIGLVSRFGGGLWADREKPFLRVTPDRFATKPRSWRALGVIECKTAGDDEHWESGTITPGGRGTGSAPLSYQAQLQWQLGILGLPIGWLGCFVVGSERQFFTVEVHFDAEWFRELADEAERFYVVNMLGDEMPMHNLKHPRTEELLKQLHPAVVVPSVQLPEDAEEWLADYVKAKAEADAAAKRLDEAKNFFRMWTGDAGAGYLGDRKIVSYPVVRSSRINVERLRTEYPEIAEKVTETSTHRRLTISVPKKS
jgi:putative phage-type endonuclease